MSFAALEPLDEYNRALKSNVHPGDWPNPEADGPYNLVVIGAGTAGLVTAGIAAGLGAKVALVERSLMGGDCLNVGCVPSKALLRAGRAAADARAAGEFGVHVGEVRVDFPAVMGRMRRLRASISPNDSAAKFRDHYGADVFLGDATFTGPDRVAVTLDDGTTRELVFKKAAICTGARAAAPPIDGLGAAGYLTNETLFGLTELPRRFAVLGGGPIGCEMAQAFARFGSEVHLIERGDRLLPHDDAQASAVVQAALERDGVALHFGTDLGRVETIDGGKRLHLSPGDVLETDELLIAVGRAPNVHGLGLEAAGVKYDERKGVTVDDRLQTSNPNIYSAGDVCSKYKFTHAADFLARTLIRNGVAPKVPVVGGATESGLVIPWCTYTSPELAHVGLTEEQASKDGTAVDAYRRDLDDVDRAILDGQTEGFVKVLCKKGTDTIVGATVVAEHAGDLISQFSLAMTHGLGLGDFANTIYPYPTQAEAIRQLGDQYNRGKLTPVVKKGFDAWFRWKR